MQKEVIEKISVNRITFTDNLVADIDGKRPYAAYASIEFDGECYVCTGKDGSKRRYNERYVIYVDTVMVEA